MLLLRAIAHRPLPARSQGKGAGDINAEAVFVDWPCGTESSVRQRDARRWKTFARLACVGTFALALVNGSLAISLTRQVYAEPSSDCCVLGLGQAAGAGLATPAGIDERQVNLTGRGTSIEVITPENAGRVGELALGAR